MNNLVVCIRGHREKESRGQFPCPQISLNPRPQASLRIPLLASLLLSQTSLGKLVPGPFTLTPQAGKEAGVLPSTK